MLRKLIGVLSLGLCAWFAGLAHADQSKSPKRNVIVMIADGSGFNSFAAGSMYQGKWDREKNCGKQVYNGPQWRQLAVSTYSLNTSQKPAGTNQQDPDLVYDPAKAWDREHGYEWLKAKYTDSAAAATALSTGHKTFNNAINWSDLDQPIKPTLSELAKSMGRAAGVVTSVEWSHATPAGFSNAHVAERDEYQDIAKQMLDGGVLDVIMGAGNPDFDNNGQPWKPKKRSAKTESTKSATEPKSATSAKPAAQAKSASEPKAKNQSKTNDPAKPTTQAKSGGTTKGITGEVADTQEYKYVGGKEVWQAIESARKKPGGLYQGYRPVSTKAEFEALCQGKTPSKILGTAQVATTLQQARTKKDTKHPSEDTPLNQNLPTLATMARGALNVLSQNPKGFCLMIEGGAVDWANHNNLASRMVQEQADFNLAVEAVVQWVESNSSWEETLVVITADHETGLLWGPDSDKEPFQPLVDNGPGKIPGLKYHGKKHTNSLVPLFARGVGAALLDKHVAGNDPVRGKYVDNTDIAKVLRAALGATNQQPRAQ